MHDIPVVSASTPTINPLEPGAGINVSGKVPSNFGWINVLAIWVLRLVILVIIYRMTMQRMGGGGALTFGKSRARIFDQSSQMKVTFSGVVGAKN